MVSITLSVPPEVKAKMDEFPEMNWSGFIRTQINKKVESLSWKEEMLKKLEEEKDFEAWTVDAGRRAKKGMFHRIFAKLPAEEQKKLLVAAR